MRSSSPVLQYCSRRLVLSYRLPHEATLSDILPSFLISSPALPPLGRVLCPPFTPLSLFFTPSPLPVSPHIHRQTNTHTPTPAPAPLLLSRSCLTASVKLITTWHTSFPLPTFEIRVASNGTAAHTRHPPD